MPWRQHLNANPLPWLLESNSPGVRYLALRDLIAGVDPAELQRARSAAHKRGPIGQILRHMKKDGYWEKPGPGYSPKYRSSVWALVTLAQLGASIHEDKRIGTACAYILDHALAEGGQFSCLSSGSAAGAIDCLQGNMCWALRELGCEDPRLDLAFDWMARSVTGEGIAPAKEADSNWRRGMPLPAPPRASSAEARQPLQYYAYKCGPGFACGENGGLPCAWGAVKVMLAFSTVPSRKRTPVIKRAMRRGVEFLSAIDPVTALYPTRTGDRPSPNWWKFGFPVFYVTDLLQLTEAAARHGHGRDPAFNSSLQFIRARQNGQARWSMEYDYLRGKTWVDFGPRAKPNKWVTLRALPRAEDRRRVLICAAIRFGPRRTGGAAWPGLTNSRLIHCRGCLKPMIPARATSRCAIWSLRPRSAKCAPRAGPLTQWVRLPAYCAG